MNKRNIILEGVDGTGKTYLAKILSDYFNMKIVWPGGPPETYSEMLLRLHEQQEAKNTLFDRVTSVSEACYRYNIEADVAWLLRRCRQEHIKKGDIFVYCCRIVGEDDTGYQDEAHQKDIEGRMAGIRIKYDVAFVDIPHIKYRAKDSNINILIDKIDVLLREGV